MQRQNCMEIGGKVEVNDKQVPCTTPEVKKNQLQSDNTTVNLTDFSPFVPVFNNYLTPSYFRYSCSELAIIETPAKNPTKPTYLEQIDQGLKPIGQKIVWANDDDECSFGQLDEGSGDESQPKDIGHSILSGFNDKIMPSCLNIDQEKTIEPSEKIPQNKSQAIKTQAKKTINQSQNPEKPVKRSCNCKKTQCLKLYCDCFRENQSCQGCSCVGCHNTPQFQLQRKNAMSSLIDRNPQAFRPKIESESHTKGCNCKKSNCQKKYCQCYQAGLKCGDNCKCQDCKNCDPKSHQKTKNYRSAIPSLYRLKHSAGISHIVPVSSVFAVIKEQHQ